MSSIYNLLNVCVVFFSSCFCNFVYFYLVWFMAFGCWPLNYKLQHLWQQKNIYTVTYILAFCSSTNTNRKSNIIENTTVSEKFKYLTTPEDIWPKFIYTYIHTYIYVYMR